MPRPILVQMGATKMGARPWCAPDASLLPHSNSQQLRILHVASSRDTTNRSVGSEKRSVTVTGPSRYRS
eukprot:2940622-Rhodomonas_salina.1